MGISTTWRAECAWCDADAKASTCDKLVDGMKQLGWGMRDGKFGKQYFCFVCRGRIEREFPEISLLQIERDADAIPEGGE